jgi:arylesterase/paraoxonase
MKWKFILLILLLVLLAFALKTCYQAGSFTKIKGHSPGIAKIYTGATGTEDIDLIPGSDFLLVSASDRRNKSEQDGIYMLDITDQDASLNKLPHTYNGAFHPHGISVFKQDSSIYLHVVNHNKEGNFIEFFEYKKDTLHHYGTIQSPDMCCPNDVVAVNKNQCYITNDHGQAEGWKRTMEDYLKLPYSYILYYDGVTFAKAYEGLNYANGINISPDGSKLYATHTTGQELLTFNRNESTGAITLTDKINLKSGLDNIDIDNEGNIWIGSHPKLFDFIAHAEDTNALSPSQVFKLTPGKSNHTDYKVEEIYLNDGSEISGSSVAVMHNNDLFIGVVFDAKLLRVKL